MTHPQNAVLDPQTAAELMGLTTADLAAMRQLRTGPAWGQLSRDLVRYNRLDIEDWLAGLSD